MSDAPVLKRFLLARDSQLPFLDIDLIDPGTGEPLGALCLIGPNGCGKSALLSRLHEAVSGSPRRLEEGEGYFLAKFAFEGEDLYLARPFGGGEGHVFSPAIETTEEWERFLAEEPPFDDLPARFASGLVLERGDKLDRAATLWFDAEPRPDGGEAVCEFGEFVEVVLRRRQEAFHRQLRAPGNRERTIAEIESDFAASSPHAMPGLRAAWNRLLAPSGLQVDFGCEDGVFRDAQGAPVPHASLGLPLRKTLLRVGLAATRPCDALFLDLPEEGLHPALAIELPEVYCSVGGASPALFVATNDPLIASHFTPTQRVRLTFDAEGKLRLLRGVAPQGAGFDELLRADFDVALAASPTGWPVAPPSAPLPESPAMTPLESLTGEEHAPETHEPPETPVAAESPQKPAPGDSSRLHRAIRASDSEGELADLIDEVISLRKI